MNNIYQHECGLYAMVPPDWSKREFGHDHEEKGDMIYITCRKIIDDNDKSYWAYTALDICANLLIKPDRKRWPDSLNHSQDAPSYLDYIDSRSRYRSGESEVRLYRPQGNMTRDPYILFYACCVHLNRVQYIEVVTIPWYRYSRRTWIWRKALIEMMIYGESVELYDKYVKLELRGIPRKKLEFTRQLVHYRAKAVGSVAVIQAVGPISSEYLYTN